MDTTIVSTDALGHSRNRYGEEVVVCRTGCGRQTTMTGTQLCDACWEAERRASRAGSSARASLAEVSAADLKDAILELVQDYGRAQDEIVRLRGLANDMQAALRCLHEAAHGAACVDGDLIEAQCADYLDPNLVERYPQPS